MPAANGDPLIDVNAPLSAENPETVPSDWFATYTVNPEGSTVTAAGDVPVVKGEPVTVVSAPLTGVIAKAETVLAPPFV
jgi:hypothetical protein